MYGRSIGSLLNLFSKRAWSDPAQGPAYPIPDVKTSSSLGDKNAKKHLGDSMLTWAKGQVYSVVIVVLVTTGLSALGQTLRVSTFNVRWYGLK